MHQDHKKFQYSGNDKSIVYLVDIQYGFYGTDIKLHFISDKKAQIIECLSAESFSIEMQNENCISINGRSYDRHAIRKSLEILAKNELINLDFANEIAEKYPFYSELLAFGGLFSRHVVTDEEYNAFKFDESVLFLDMTDKPQPEASQPTPYVLM